MNDDCSRRKRRRSRRVADCSTQVTVRRRSCSCCWRVALKWLWGDVLVLVVDVWHSSDCEETFLFLLLTHGGLQYSSDEEYVTSRGQRHIATPTSSVHHDYNHLIKNHSSAAATRCNSTQNYSRDSLGLWLILWFSSGITSFDLRKQSRVHFGGAFSSRDILACTDETKSRAGGTSRKMQQTWASEYGKSVSRMTGFVSLVKPGLSQWINEWNFISEYHQHGATSGHQAASTGIQQAPVIVHRAAQDDQMTSLQPVAIATQPRQHHHLTDVTATTTAVREMDWSKVLPSPLTFCQLIIIGEKYME